MDYTRQDIVSMLLSQGAAREELFRRAVEVRNAAIGDGVYLRGLIEYSNVCRKNCLYCGIRRDSRSDRYTLSAEQVLRAARFAWENRYGSVVLQGGENTSPEHTALITRLLHEITAMSNGELGITLSLGEQTPDVYREWKEAGATRYLLRIETSDRELYRKIHPDDAVHDFDRRVEALHDLRDAGLMLGTGVMIGLPFQTVESLADDLTFMQGLDIDMCGMGPYILSEGTPLARFADRLETEQWRFNMTLKMIASLRILMPDINIAATTALQAIDPHGRVKAIDAGANVIMPNLTPDDMRGNYLLYNNKPMSLDSKILERNIRYGEKGDPQHYERQRRADVKKITKEGAT